MTTSRRGFLASLAAFTGGLVLSKNVSVPAEPFTATDALAQKNMLFPTFSGGKWEPVDGSHLPPFDGAYDLGYPGATRPRDLFVPRESHIITYDGRWSSAIRRKNLTCTLTVEHGASAFATLRNAWYTGDVIRVSASPFHNIPMRVTGMVQEGSSSYMRFSLAQANV